MKTLFLAFQFLTIIPFRLKTEITERDIGRTTAFFPAVALVQGVLLFALVKLLTLFLPSGLIASGMILFLIVINGGLHIDGLSDTFDALAVTQGTQEKRLSVMKDSSAGPIGVTAIVLVILIKFLALNELLNPENMAIYLMPLMGKWGMLIAIFTSKPARTEGLGKIFFHKREGIDVLVASVCTLAPLALLIGWPGILNFFIISLMSFFSSRFFMVLFGGLTGDCLGALSELSEMAYLIIALACKELSC